jgi:molybdate transport system regulatory protein
MKGIQVENRIWIVKNGKNFLGHGRIQLLEAIHATGSISKASTELGMSYKKAWQLIKSMNLLSEEPLVVKETGGKNGGGTILTRNGIDIIETFRSLEKRNKDFLKKEAKKLNAL